MRRADGRVPGLLVPHVLAAALMLWLAWFVRQPIGIGMLVSVAVAVATVAVVLVQPLLSPLVVLAALLLERPADAATPLVMAAPASP